MKNKGDHTQIVRIDYDDKISKRLKTLKNLSGLKKSQIHKNKGCKHGN